MKVTVIGMGKIGLPLAVNFARHQAMVTGLDIQDNVVSLINQGIEPFPGEKDLEFFLRKCLNENVFFASTDKEQSISNADVLVVCIPLIVDEKGEPDFTNIDQLSMDIGVNLSPGTLICFETTLPVGTTRNRFTLAIERFSGLKVGIDFFVVFSPERVLTGRVFEDLRRYPKLVGGVTEQCTKAGEKFYGSVLSFDERPDLQKPNGVWGLKNCEAAEFAKIAETTYRDVNIGLANEFSIFASKHGLEVQEVIEAANSQPYSRIHTPGISVGGHCIPVYPRFYMWKNPNSGIVSAAREQNLSMPKRAVEQIKLSLGTLTNLRVGVLGITYREGVKEHSFSGAIDLLRLLNIEGANVYGLDPFYEQSEIQKLGFLDVAELDKLDVIVLHTDHQEFTEIDYGSLQELQVFYDGRNSYSHLAKTANFKYLSI